MDMPSHCTVQSHLSEFQPRSCKRSDTLFQKSLLFTFYFRHGESTSTASQLTSSASQKSRDLSKVLLLLHDLGFSSHWFTQHDVVQAHILNSSPCFEKTYHYNWGHSHSRIFQYKLLCYVLPLQFQDCIDTY